jgi:predicted component of viral defense system (DUF524 family)
MNTKTNDLAQRANEKYLSLVGKKLQYIVERCYPGNLGMFLKEINDITAAAKKLNASSVSSSTVLTDAEIEQLIGQLSPLRELQMADDARAIVVEAMTSHHIPVDSLNQPAT